MQNIPVKTNYNVVAFISGHPVNQISRIYVKKPHLK